MLRQISFFLTFFIALLGRCTVACAQSELNPTIAKLLEQLASPKFEIRELASDQLLRCGWEAIEPLKQLVESTNPRESRVRARAILDQLEKQRLSSVAQAFLVDSNELNAHGLPAWSALRQFVGGTRSAKQFFLELIRCQPDTAGMIDELHHLRLANRDTQALQVRLAELSAKRANMLLEQTHAEGGVQLGDSAAMLLVAATMDHPVPYEVSDYIRNCADLNFSGNLNRSGNRDCLLALLAQWIPKSPDSMAPEVMRIAFELDQPSVLPIARKHLSKSFDPFTRERALLCFSKFGQASDVPALLPHASDSTVIESYSELEGDDSSIVVSRNAPPGLVAPASFVPQKMIRINDLTVAVAMQLLKENPEAIFPNLQADRFKNNWRLAVAVAESEKSARDAAIRQWLATQAAFFPKE